MFDREVGPEEQRNLRKAWKHSHSGDRLVVRETKKGVKKGSETSFQREKRIRRQAVRKIELGCDQEGDPCLGDSREVFQGPGMVEMLQMKARGLQGKLVKLPEKKNDDRVSPH